MRKLVCSTFLETAAGVDGRYVTVTSCRRLGSRGTSAAVFAASRVSPRSTRNDPASSEPVASTVVPTTTGQPCYILALYRSPWVS